MLCGALLFSCGSSLKVMTENRASEKLMAYKSFMFDEDYDYPSANFTFTPFEKEQIKYFISEGLTAKKMDERENGELVVKVLGKIANIQEFNNDAGPYNSWDWYNRDRHFNDRRGRMQKTITLIIDLYDSNTNKLVWRGEAIDDLDRKDVIEEKLEELVLAILKEFEAGK